MKKCAYCGKDYPDTAERCSIDAEPLIGGNPLRAEPAVADAEPILSARLIDLSGVPGAFAFSEGYPRPNFDLIGNVIQQNVSLEEHDLAWTEVAVQWLQQLRSELGGGYGIHSSTRFVLLSTLNAEAAERLLRFAESTLQNIEQSLQSAAWQSGYGKRVILLFDEDEDYYDYVSYFYAEGIHPASAGCVVPNDYAHIALKNLGTKQIETVLTHELTHLSVVHLPIPLWLNEGLALTFDRTARARAGEHQPLIDHELKERHLSFWNRDTIQQFWSGLAFNVPGDSVELSYHLAEIIVHLLMKPPASFVEFLKRATWDDAGQTAALDCLGIDLGKTAATFLGEGDWRPSRKSIAQYMKSSAPAAG